MSGMDDVVRLSPVDLATLIHAFENATGEVLVAVDDIDRALKVKVAGRWSPPIGVLEQRLPGPVVDAGRSNRDDLVIEARTARDAVGAHPLTCTRPCCIDPADLR